MKKLRVLPNLRALEFDDSRAFDSFKRRHIGPRPEQLEEMLKTVGHKCLEELIDNTVPAGIRLKKELSLEPASNEDQVLKRLRHIASFNTVFRSFIGMGFSDTITPPVIQRNILENPGWYTQYTPYQPEISQGRQEALINFQTMVCDLTGMEIANASLLDEGSAAAEAMTLCSRIKNKAEKTKFFVSSDCHRHVIGVVKTRAKPLGIEVVLGKHDSVKLDKSFFGALVQFPTSEGRVVGYKDFAKRVHEADALLVVSADILSLCVLEAPGEWGADVVVGNSQRFGVPLGFGGPHAAFFATRDAFKRNLPGRMVGVSNDSQGKPAYRLSLQTREQHIRREKATSNICTAQVLLAILAGMYAVYHGPKGLKRIAERVHFYTALLGKALEKLDASLCHKEFFDTLRVRVSEDAFDAVCQRAQKKQINFRLFEDNTFGISLDETTRLSDIADIVEVFTEKAVKASFLKDLLNPADSCFPKTLKRKTDYLSHSVFNSYHSETELLRYIRRLESRDLSLTTSMIPLGSCTMKLNAAVEMYPITWPEFGHIHPFVPEGQIEGYRILMADLRQDLSAITGHEEVSFQPNAGSQGEYAGLLAIKAYQDSCGEAKRNVCLIPASAHGTNPASAVLAGMKVVSVNCDKDGNIDVEDLRAKAEEHKESLSALMITYPSTHGVFEEAVVEICGIIHSAGGQVYMDGANLNAQVGLCRPGDIGADVCHLNLHKTFSIPHGGGGPGVGPITVKEHLAPYVPGHSLCDVATVGPVASGPWGSASILPISWVYIKLMGEEGLTEASKIAILNANYIAKRLESYYPVLYTGKNGTVAHECILDLRHFKHAVGIDVSDVAKRLMDYGFHAPTVSFPVAETLMVEPTESESKEELDRFCDAMISIRREIEEIENNTADKDDNVLKNAPHTAEMVSGDNWTHSYSREKAAYPAPWLKAHKFWPPVGRIDNAYGDRNLFCSCVPS